MITATAGTLILALILSSNNHGNEYVLSKAVVSDGTHAVLTAENFALIRKFILDQGLRQTYCNKYNNNPYWTFPELNAYLDPTPIVIKNDSKTSKPQYNALTFRVTGKEGTDYWHILFDEMKSSLSVMQSGKKDPQVLIKEISEFFEKALAEIHRLARNKDSNANR